jgi:dTDP-glucose pyrophosphorylase
MAGRGSRFRDTGVATPKPLIDVRGRPMYAWATESLPLELATRLIFVCLAEHLETYPLAKDIRARYGRFEPIIIPVEGVTEGQACTVLLAKRHIDSDRPLAIFNADTYCRSQLARVLEERGASADGVIGVFQAPGDKWSFARLDARGQVIETREKERISEWATTGLYHFARGADFVAHAEAMIAENDRTRGEFYVAPLYNRLIRAGLRIFPEMSEDVWGLGTPEDLSHFLANCPQGCAPRSFK